MKYEMIDGRVIEAESAKELCVRLWKAQKFAIHHSVEEWMTANAKVVKNITGQDCSADGFEAHVHDLIKQGILKQL